MGKQITALTLRSDFDETCNIPVDDSIQSYRVTGAQVKSFLNGTFQIKSANYTILKDDGIVLIDDTSTDREVTLPAASQTAGRLIKIGNISSDKGKVTITSLSNLELDCKGSFVVVISDGTNYHIVDLYFPKKLINLADYTFAVKYSTGLPWVAVTGQNIIASDLIIYKSASLWCAKILCAYDWTSPSDDEICAFIDNSTIGLESRAVDGAIVNSSQPPVSSYIKFIASGIQLYTRFDLPVMGVVIENDIILGSKPSIID